MAGSRLEKFGTIYKRVQGLLRSGAMKEADKPLWCEVYEAFPPLDPPVYERPVPTREIPKIFYPEDIIRAQFYKTYGNPDVMDLTNERVKTTCQRFVDKYLELLQTESTTGNLFASTAAALKEDGLRLRTLQDVEETAKADARVAAPPPRLEQQSLSVSSIFGETTVRQGQTEEQDFILDDDDATKSPKL